MPEADTKDYVVTKLAGPKVAGHVAKAGDTLQLTASEAAFELLAGAIADPTNKDKDPLAGSKKLADIQSRAKGFDGVKDEDEQRAEAQADEPAPDAPPAADNETGTSKSAGKANGGKV